MKTTRVRMVNGSLLTTSPISYYTTPAKTTATISAFSLTNNSTGVVLVSVYLAETPDDAIPANKVLNDYPLAGKESFNAWTAIAQNIGQLGSIYASCDVGGVVSMVVSGYETTN